jgi:hypothetical protein
MPIVYVDQVDLALYGVVNICSDSFNFLVETQRPSDNINVRLDGIRDPVSLNPIGAFLKTRPGVVISDDVHVKAFSYELYCKPVDIVRKLPHNSRGKLP